MLKLEVASVRDQIRLLRNMASINNHYIHFYMLIELFIKYNYTA